MIKELLNTIFPERIEPSFEDKWPSVYRKMQEKGVLDSDAIHSDKSIAAHNAIRSELGMPRIFPSSLFALSNDELEYAINSEIAAFDKAASVT